MLRSEARKISAIISRSIKDFAFAVRSKEPFVFEMRKRVNGQCVFLVENECQIYDARPLVCRFYPFELKAFRNSRHAFECAEDCRGLGKGRTCDKAFFEELYNQAIEHFKDV